MNCERCGAPLGDTHICIPTIGYLERRVEKMEQRIEYLEQLLEEKGIKKTEPGKT